MNDEILKLADEIEATAVEIEATMDRIERKMDAFLATPPAYQHTTGPAMKLPPPDRRAPQTPAQKMASPNRRATDPLALFTDEQRHQHSLMQIKLRGGRLAPLPACFTAPNDAGADDDE